MHHGVVSVVRGRESRSALSMPLAFQGTFAPARARGSVLTWDAGTGRRAGPSGPGIGRRARMPGSAGAEGWRPPHTHSASPARVSGAAALSGAGDAWQRDTGCWDDRHRTKRPRGGCRGSGRVVRRRRRSHERCTGGSGAVRWGRAVRWACRPSPRRAVEREHVGERCGASHAAAGWPCSSTRILSVWTGLLSSSTRTVFVGLAPSLCCGGSTRFASSRSMSAATAHVRPPAVFLIRVVRNTPVSRTAAITVVSIVVLTATAPVRFLRGGCGLVVAAVDRRVVRGP